jgi:hypothetical protein
LINFRYKPNYYQYKRKISSFSVKSRQRQNGKSRCPWWQEFLLIPSIKGEIGIKQKLQKETVSLEKWQIKNKKTINNLTGQQLCTFKAKTASTSNAGNIWTYHIKLRLFFSKH